MNAFFNFSCRTISSRFAQALENHLVQLHEMIAAVGLTQNFKSKKISNCIERIVGALLAEPAQVAKSIQKGGEV